MKLQSANEEYTPSKERKQPEDEEVMAVNAGLQSKIKLLAGIKSEMNNLLNNTGAGTIFPDIVIRVRWFIPGVARLCTLVESDVGRPLGDITSLIVQDDLTKEARMVLNSLIPKEKTINTVDNLWFPESTGNVPDLRVMYSKSKKSNLGEPFIHIFSIRSATSR